MNDHYGFRPDREVKLIALLVEERMGEISISASV